MTDKAIILLSGGLDSSTCLAYATSKGFECYALSFHYGQKNNAELHAAKRIAAHYNVSYHNILELPISKLGGSALTDSQIDIPDYDANSNDIPITYVPARNTIFLSFAVGWAEALNAHAIFTGVSHVDYSGYPDCRPEYISAFEKMANLATKAGIEGNGVTIETPLIHLSKAETVQLGTSLGLDYSLTISCYRATSDGKACGNCDSCEYRKKGFIDANLNDPTNYI